MPVASVCARQPFGTAMIAVMDSVEHEFHSGGDAKLIEDPKQIFLYGMLTEGQFLRDLSIGKPFSY